MNSAPSSRYRTAREPITPTSDSALEIGCVCTTTLMAHTTATTAKMRKSMTSIYFVVLFRKPGNQEAGHQQIEHGYREEKLPREAHQLVVTEAGQSGAHPHKQEENRTGLRREPEERQQPALHDRQEENAGNDQEDNSEDWQGKFVTFARGVGAVIEGGATSDGEDHRGHEVGPPRHRPRGHPAAQEEQRGHGADRNHVGVLGHEETGELHAAVFGMEAGDQFVFG